MPEQENQGDLLAMCDQALTDDKALNAVEWTVGYEGGKSRNVMVVVIPEPQTAEDEQELGRMLTYLMSASGYVSRPVMAQCPYELPKASDLQWEENAHA